jgi:hypothetical protein
MAGRIHHAKRCIAGGSSIGKKRPISLEEQPEKSDEEAVAKKEDQEKELG